MDSRLDAYFPRAPPPPPRAPPRAEPPPRALKQLRIGDLKRVVPLDRVQAAKRELLALEGRPVADAAGTARALELLARLRSFAVALETLETTDVGEWIRARRARARAHYERRSRELAAMSAKQ